MAQNQVTKISCAGNALLDITAFVENDFFTDTGIAPGSTNHLDAAFLTTILLRLKDPLCLAGGGAANTAKVFVTFGGQCSFAGSVGDDANSWLYKRNLHDEGVRDLIQTNPGATGVFCALIQPNGIRTVLVSPGVASLLDPAAVPADFFDKDRVLHVDGFLAADNKRFLALINRASDAGTRISIDVGGKGIAAQNRKFFKNLIAYASWVFMNEDEYFAIAEATVEESLADFSAETKATIIVKRGETGAVCFSSGILVQSPVREIKPLDETGAGDAFAAGFLFAALHGAALPQCMRLANRAAEHIIQVPGLLYEKSLLRGIPAEFLY